jgi:hypothetical protein
LRHAVSILFSIGCDLATEWSPEPAPPEHPSDFSQRALPRNIKLGKLPGKLGKA